MLDILQLHLFGEIDPEIKAEFVPLTDEDDAARAATLKTEADRDSVYLDRGVLDAGEVRRKLSEDPASGYGFIDPEMVPQGEEEPDPGEGESPDALPAQAGEAV